MPRLQALALVLGLAIGLATAPEASAQAQFREVAAERGISGYHMATGMGGSVSAADYDDDGDIDLFLPNGPRHPDQLFRNLGDGHFEEVAAAVGLASLESHRSSLWVDIDADRDLDLVVTGGDCYALACGPGVKNLSVYEQVTPDEFREVTFRSGLLFGAGLTQSPHASAISAGDANRDGYLDLILGLWAGKSPLFLNQQDGSFIEDPQFQGGLENDHFWQSVWHDFDGDGWQDILVAIDFDRNHLFLNQRDGTFVDVAPALGIDNAMNDMGLTLGDYDNDGDFDYYITNVFDFTGRGERNVLYRNLSERGTLAFEEVGRRAGVDQGEWGWGCTFFDCDNDAWLDLAATNGFGYGHWRSDRSRFFMNPGAPPFVFREAGQHVGFADGYWGSSLVAADIDRDGDLDLLQTTNLGGPFRLLLNETSRGAGQSHYLSIRPRMDGPNHRAIGAVVHVEAGGLEMVRLITAGTGFMGQEPAEAFFGLGAATIVDRLRVDWPDGDVTEWTRVAVDQLRTVVPGGTPGDLDMDADVDEQDLHALLRSWGPCAGCEADLNGDGVVDLADLLLLVENWG